ncbi:MAG: GAF domain-containing protein [Actinobacteria bacterium]|nr:GAF domain-containing protein [Actinomycetota bacterium]
MQRRERVGLTLTNRLLLLSALIVVVTTLLVAATSAAGVYEMAKRLEVARQSAYRDILSAEIGGGLDGAFERLRVAAEQPALRGNDPGEYRQCLSNSAIEGAQYFEGMVLLDGDGTVLESWPPETLGGSTPEELGATETSVAVEPYIWVEPDGDSTAGVLWALATVDVPGGSPRLLMGRIRTEFVERALENVATLPGEPTTVLFDGDGHILYRSEGLPFAAAPTVQFVADAEQSSVGMVRLEGDVSLAGPYVSVASPEGLGWTVAVLESPSVVWRETSAALMPGVLGWLAALAAALIASLAVVSRVVQPLKHLETRARALASGAAFDPETAIEHGTAGEKDEVGRLVEALNSIGRRLNRMQDIAELLARASDRGLMLAGINSAISHMLGAVDAEVLLLGDDGRLDLVAAEGVLSGRQDVTVVMSEVPWIAEAIEEGRPAEAPAGRRDPYLHLHGTDASSALAAPLQAGQDTIGVAVVVRHGGKTFTEAEAETVRSFAAQASVALQNSRLFEDERRSRKEAESLRAIAERAAAPGDIEEVLYDVARMQAELVGFGVPHVILVDRSAYGLQASEDPVGDRSWLALWKAVSQDAAETAGPLYVQASQSTPGIADALRGRRAEGALLTPLHRASGFAGLMVLAALSRAGVPSEQKLVLAGTVGKQASLALENAYLYQQAKRRADNLETIFRISHAVGSSLQSRIVLNRVLDVVQKILAADAVMLMTYDSQRKQIAVPMARGILHRDMLEATFRPGEDVPGRVFETREPERYDRISSSDTRLLNSAAEQGLESLLAVPLLARGRSIGVLVVFAREPSAFTTDDLDLLRTFASQAALAIDTADMFSREHNVATILQESILPTRLPHIPGITASSVYLPAGTDAEIGGDYYDLFSMPDGRVVVSIGDVCGKGVAAATRTSMIRHALRGMAVSGLEPARMLQELNAMLLEAGDATSIVTLWLGCIDVQAGLLSYADGGHPPGLLLRPSDGRIERLATTGALLGAVPDIEWGQEEMPLEAGSLLLLYTDGVTEARSGGRFFGEGRVHRALRAGGSPSAVTQRLLGQVQRFAPGELRDDAAILAVGYRRDEAPVTDGVTSGRDSGK